MYSSVGGTRNAFFAVSTSSVMGVERSKSTSRTMRSDTKSRSVSLIFFFSSSATAVAGFLSSVTFETPSKDCSSDSFLPLAKKHACCGGQRCAQARRSAAHVWSSEGSEISCAVRPSCTRTVDEPSYMMAKALTRGGKKRGKVSIELDEEVCRARALELAHIAYLANAHAPGAAAAFRECLLLAVGYAGSAGCDDRGLALALADSLQTFRGSSDQKPDAREARKRLRTAFLERVNDSDDDCNPGKKKKGRRSPRFGSEEALDLADALDGYAIAEIGSRIYHVRVRCDAIVQKVKCADANGLLKVKVSRAKMIGTRLMTVQERRVLARIPDPVVRKRVCREE